MSWLNVNLNESLSNIRGQLTTLASNVLSESTEDAPELDERDVSQLKQLLTDQEVEIKRLQRENSEILKRINSNCNSESWSWDTIETPVPLPASQTSSDVQISFSVEDLKLKIAELERENLELTQSLEQLDQDCQQTTDKLVVIKDELQTENSHLKLQHQDMNKEITRLKGSLTNLQQERNSKDEKIELLVAQLEDVKHDSFAETEQRVSKLRQNEELEAMVSDYSEQISTYKKELAELRNLQESAIASSQSSKIQMTKYYNVLHDEIASILNNPESLPHVRFQESEEENVLEYQNFVHSVVAIISNLQKNCEGLREENVLAMREQQLLITKKEHEIEKLRIASQEVGKKFKNKERLIEDLEKECSKLGHNNEMLIQRLQDVSAERQGLQTIPEASELEKCYKRIQQLEQKLSDEDELQTQLALKQGELHLARTTIEEYTTKCQNMEHEVQHKQEEVEVVNSQVTNLENTILQYSVRQKELENLLEEAQTETFTLHEELTMKIESQRQFGEMSVVVDEMETNIRTLTRQVEFLSKENEELVNSRSNYIANYKSFREDVKKLITSYTILRDSNTKDLKEKNELMFKIEQLQNTSDEFQALKCDIDELQKSLAAGQTENTELAIQNEKLQRQLSELTESRNEVIALVQSKHQESLIYHTEIQRLQQLLAIEAEKCKTFQTQLAELNGASFTHDDLAAKEREIEKLQEQNEFLREKCEKLAKNLLDEQSEKSERELSLQKQLDGLREHLLEMEAMYTKEVQAAESKCSEMQLKLQAVVEQEKNSSNRFTSANIRANQQLETLQTNLQLVTNQRDELKRKVSEQEDQTERQNAAICNLQIVLEQFQRDKEKAIYEETQRVQRQILAERDIQAKMQQQIYELQRQLDESKVGLKAAVRLSDQVEMSKQQVASMRDEVTSLQCQLAASEEKYRRATNQADERVDKLLVKNLVIGLIACNNRLNKDQNQILKIISTVLDFNQQDIEKVNLHRKDEGGSWFSNLMQAHALPEHAMSSDSLTQAFVKFLEAESKPRRLPNLLDTSEFEAATKSQPKSAECSANSSRKTSVRQSPILLNEVVLPTFADFSANRNSSAILKNVLKDNSNTG